jgi:hypothetical protein
MRSSARLFQIFVPAGVSEISQNLNFAINQNLFLLPISSNGIINKIGVFFSISILSEAISFFDIRLRGLNKDGVVYTLNGGNILNPLSGPWDATLTKNTDFDLILSTNKNFIEFQKGILLGGFQPISYSVKFIRPISTNLNISAFLYIDYE